MSVWSMRDARNVAWVPTYTLKVPRTTTRKVGQPTTNEAISYEFSKTYNKENVAVFMFRETKESDDKFQPDWLVTQTRVYCSSPECHVRYKALGLQLPATWNAVACKTKSLVKTGGGDQRNRDRFRVIKAELICPVFNKHIAG
jgi:hypothetical protein